jgi:hypothetical protein
MSYSACQTGPSVSYWCQGCCSACVGSGPPSRPQHRGPHTQGGMSTSARPEAPSKIRFRWSLRCRVNARHAAALGGVRTKRRPRPSCNRPSRLWSPKAAAGEPLGWQARTPIAHAHAHQETKNPILHAAQDHVYPMCFRDAHQETKRMRGQPSVRPLNRRGQRCAPPNKTTQAGPPAARSCVHISKVRANLSGRRPGGRR